MNERLLVSLISWCLVLVAAGLGALIAWDFAPRLLAW